MDIGECLDHPTIRFLCVSYAYHTRNEYNIVVKNSICVYTCITRGYDSLKQPEVVSQGVDYICFTDNMSQHGGVWKLRAIPDDLKHLNNVKKQRIIKICPHRYLNEYDISVWVDGSFQLIGDILKFINQYDLEKTPFYTRIHPARNCIYKEAEVCVSTKRVTKDVADKQMSRYKAEGYPENAGLGETGIILRKHNDAKCQMMSNIWAAEVLNGSHRDQLSFNYACWKTKFLPGYLTNEFKVRDNSVFIFKGHGKK